MNEFLEYPRMLWSSRAGWERIARTRPTMAALVFHLILPLSLLPPLMLVHASGHIGSLHFPSVTRWVWWSAAALFLLLELGTVPLMACILQSLSRANGGTGKFLPAFTVAAVAPVPLWLSALVLFQDNVMVAIALPVLALFGSAALIYRGVAALLHLRDEVVAAEVANITIAIGLLAWLFILAAMLIPVLIAR
jgi:hypothetical protein